MGVICFICFTLLQSCQKWVIMFMWFWHVDLLNRACWELAENSDIYQINTKRWTNAGLMLAHRLRRWASIKPLLFLGSLAYLHRKCTSGRPHGSNVVQQVTGFGQLIIGFIWPLYEPSLVSVRTTEGCDADQQSGYPDSPDDWVPEFPLKRLKCGKNVHLFSSLGEHYFQTHVQVRYCHVCGSHSVLGEQHGGHSHVRFLSEQNTFNCYGYPVRCNPVNTKHLYNICTMLDQRRRRWADVV